MRKTISYLIVAAMFVAAMGIADVNAQIKGVGKNIKKNIPKTNNSKVNSETKELSKDCEYIKREIDRKVKMAERYLEEGKFNLVENYLKGLQTSIDKWKKEPCPFPGKYQKKHDELEAQLAEAAINADPVGYLIHAMETSDTELAEKAIAAGADVDGEQDRATPLIAAVKKDNLEMAKYIIGKGANVNKGCEYPTDAPLVFAIKNKNKAMCEFLISKGANNKQGVNVMLLASSIGDLEIFKLISNKLSIDAFVDEADLDRRPRTHRRMPTTLCIAEDSENKVLVDYIVSEIKKDNLSRLKNPIHKKYVNSLVFSSTKIPETNANESTFINSFNASKDIFARVYLETELKDILFGNGSCYKDKKFREYTIWIKLPHMEKNITLGTYREDNLSEKNTMDIYINTHKGYREIYKEFYCKLKEGENKATVFVKFGSGSDSYTIEREAVFVRKANEDYKVGKTFADYKAGMNNASLESAALNYMKKYAENSGWKETFSKVKIKSTDWSTINHDITGVILGRYMSFYCYATWPDGHCTVQEFGLKQEYTGSGYSKTLKYYFVGSQSTVDCN